MRRRVRVQRLLQPAASPQFSRHCLHRGNGKAALLVFFSAAVLFTPTASLAKLIIQCAGRHHEVRHLPRQSTPQGQHHWMMRLYIPTGLSPVAGMTAPRHARAAVARLQCTARCSATLSAAGACHHSVGAPVPGRRRCCTARVWIVGLAVPRSRSQPRAWKRWSLQQQPLPRP